MADIGPMTAKLVANADGVFRGVKQAGAALTQGAPMLAAKAKEIGQAIGSGLGSALSVGVKAGLAGLAATGLSGFLSAGGLAAAYVSGASQIRELAAAAQKATSPVREFQAAAAALGSVEGAAEAMAKLNVAITDSILAGARADAFENAGLDPRRLFLADNAFEQVADTIAGMEGAWRRSWHAMQLFGEEYRKFLPMLSRGSGFIAEQQRLLDSFGANVTPGMAASVKAADRFFHQFAVLKQAFSVQVAGGVGALIAALSDRLPKLPEMGLHFRGLAGQIIDAAEAVARFGLSVHRAFTNPEVRSALFDLLSEAASYFGNRLMQAFSFGLGKLLQGVGEIKVSRFLPALQLGEVGKLVEAVSRGFGIDAQFNQRGVRKAWEAMTGSLASDPAWKRLQEFFDDARGYLGSPGAGIDRNPFDVVIVGAQQLASQTKGPLESFRGEVRSLAGLLDQAADAMEKLEASARDAAPDLAALLRGFTPIGGGMAGALADAQRIIDDLERNAAMKAFGALRALESAAGGGDQYRAVAAMRAGSKEAFSLIAARENEVRETPLDRLRRLLEIANARQEEEIAVGKEILQAVRDGKINLRIGGP